MVPPDSTATEYWVGFCGFRRVAKVYFSCQVAKVGAAFVRPLGHKLMIL